jgi:hypothetical protein
MLTANSTYVDSHSLIISTFQLIRNKPPAIETILDQVMKESSVANP